MTPEQAKRASETLEDVATPDGCMVTIDRLSTRKGQPGAVVGGGWQGEHHEEWFSIDQLTAREDF